MSAQPPLRKRAVDNGWYDADCRRCGRLAAFLDDVSTRHPDYHCGPVPPFGDRDARLLIVGLAPGMHGANASGRPFTGDHAGILLYRTLHRFGYASATVSRAPDDGLTLIDCRITNAVKCLPPQNKPTTAEVKNCLPFLAREIDHLPPGGVILALGGLAHGAVLRCLGRRAAELPFGHGASHRLNDGRHLVSSYHCSRYNTQTGRLTTPMFEAVFEHVNQLLATPS